MFDRIPIPDDQETAAEGLTQEALVAQIRNQYEQILAQSGNNPPAIRRGMIELVTGVQFHAPYSQVHAALVEICDQVFGNDLSRWPLPIVLKLLPPRDMPPDFLNRVRNAVREYTFDLFETAVIGYAAGLQWDEVNELLVNWRPDVPARDIREIESWSEVQTLGETAKTLRRHLELLDEAFNDVVQTHIEYYWSLHRENTSLVRPVEGELQVMSSTTRTEIDAIWDGLEQMLPFISPTTAEDLGLYDEAIRLLRELPAEAHGEFLIGIASTIPFGSRHVQRIMELMEAFKIPLESYENIIGICQEILSSWGGSGSTSSAIAV